MGRTHDEFDCYYHIHFDDQPGPLRPRISSRLSPLKRKTTTSDRPESPFAPRKDVHLFTNERQSESKEGAVAIAFERSLPPETCRFLSLFGAFRGASNADLLSYQCFTSSQPGRCDERTKMFGKDDARRRFKPAAKAIVPSDTPSHGPPHPGLKDVKDAHRYQRRQRQCACHLCATLGGFAVTAWRLRGEAASR